MLRTPVVIPHSPQRRSFSRRSERGPGKSPSPARNSPRRHSPIPYSPKRQHRAVSPVALDDFYDVMLSPTHPSAVPHLVDGSRAQSLTSDEFTCISYSDPFSSPVFYNPQSVLGISTEMDSGQSGEMGTKDLGDMDIVADMDGKTSWLDGACLSPEDICLEDALVLLEEGGFQDTPGTDQVGQDGDLFLYEVDEQQTPNKTRRRLTHTDSGHFLAASCPDAASFYDTELMSQNLGEQICSTTFKKNSSNCKTNTSAQTRKMPVLADKECIPDAEGVGTDSSSEEEMEDEMMNFQNGAAGIGSVSQPQVLTDLSAAPCLGQVSAFQSSDSITSATSPNIAGTDLMSQSSQERESSNTHVFKETGKPTSPRAGLGNVNCVPSAGDLIKNSDFQGFSPQQCTVEELSLDDSSWCPFEEEKISLVLGSHTQTKPCPGMESELALDVKEEESRGSTDLSILQHFSNEYNSSSNVFPDDIMTYSLCTQHSPDRPPSVSADIILEASPEKTPYHAVSKTPEDFALPRLVGCPPLQFKHCNNVILIHSALSNPYNPDLPTPPIVLTHHDSFQDLGGSSPCNVQYAPDESTSFYSSPTVYHYPPWSLGEGYSRSDISKSSSCPNLFDNDNPQFTNPHQMWPGWDQSHHFWDNQMTEQEGFRHSAHSMGSHPTSSFPERQPQSMNCFSVSKSPCSSRTAVIDRLRKVVEKRLSRSLDSLETSRLQHT